MNTILPYGARVKEIGYRRNLSGLFRSYIKTTKCYNTTFFILKIPVINHELHDGLFVAILFVMLRPVSGYLVLCMVYKS